MTKIYSSFLVCNAFEEISEFNGFLSSLDTENKLIFSCSVCTLFALKMMDRHTAALQHDLIRRYLIPIDKDMKIYPQIELFLFLKLKGDLLLNDSCVLNEIRDMIDEEEDIEDDFLAAYTESLFEGLIQFHVLLIDGRTSISTFFQFFFSRFSSFFFFLLFSPYSCFLHNTRRIP